MQIVYRPLKNDESESFLPEAEMSITNIPGEYRCMQLRLAPEFIRDNNIHKKLNISSNIFLCISLAK